MSHKESKTRLPPRRFMRFVWYAHRRLCATRTTPTAPRARHRRLRRPGESSKEIAERLYLSVRTVNNHLQNVYSKLGVGGRRQLAAALTAAPPEQSGTADRSPAGD